jgi:hypothetical protein
MFRSCRSAHPFGLRNTAFTLHRLDNGGLMDTEYMRHAAHDVQGEHDAATQARQHLQPAWRTVLRRAIARLMHR